MLCNRSAGKIILSLSPGDFQFSNWRDFLDDLKDRIAPHEREYDPELQQWYIQASEYNVSIVHQLTAKYFPPES